MRNTAFFFLCLLITLGACNSDQGSEQKLWDEVMAVHDEVMPKMDDLNRISRDIRAGMDTVPPIDTLRKLQQLDMLIRLEKAEEGMMSWMSELKVLDDLQGTQSHREIMSYLESEKQRIGVVRDSTEAAIAAGTKMLEEK